MTEESGSRRPPRGGPEKGPSALRNVSAFCHVNNSLTLHYLVNGWVLVSPEADIASVYESPLPSGRIRGCG